MQCYLDSKSVECSDCSYTYDGSHEKLVLLRERLWEGYYLGAFGDYVLDDFLGANHTQCASEGTGCISMQQYEKEELGVGAQPPTAEEEEEENGLGFIPG